MLARTLACTRLTSLALLRPAAPPQPASKGCFSLAVASLGCVRGSERRGASTTATESTMALYHGIMNSDRSSLARGITLVESTKWEHKQQAHALLSLILKDLKNKQKHAAVFRPQAASLTFRIGLSGPPGVGKSTFIESFGMYLTRKGHRVAVLAVDPSSTRTGGSILGDKTRMVELSKEPSAYVRPSPSRGTLGGVARNTMEAILLCEGAGFDVILVETVGVGQSETMVADMVDMFVLLVPPAGGDELQGIKKGIVEIADLVVVNKADGDLLPAARVAQLEYTSALKLLRPKSESWRPKVVAVSSLSNHAVGHDDVWGSAQEFRSLLWKSGEWEMNRSNQAKTWMWRQVSDEVMTRLNHDPNIAALAGKMEAEVSAGTLAPGTAADLIVEKFMGRSD